MPLLDHLAHSFVTMAATLFKEKLVMLSIYGHQWESDVLSDAVLNLTFIDKLTKKMRIAIPPSLGRSMLGIVDETGLLQCEQVFIHYTVDCIDKLSQVVADKHIYRGKVLITKNPAVVSGDVRVFEAVDCVAHFMTAFL